MRLAPSLAVLNAAVLASAVLVAGGDEPRGPAPVVVPRTAVALPTTSPAPVAPAAAPARTPAAAPPTAPAPAARPRTARPPAPKAPRPPAAPVTRRVTRTGWQPYARVGPVTLHFPGQVIEVVGLHQSGHDGAQPQQPVGKGARIGLLGSRARDTNPQGAADIVVDPAREVRSPVTGTVLRAGTYALYCDHVDQFLVVEPDARPGWEVKLLHFEGLAVAAGDRVQAGVTVVGSGARVLPFASQVDKHTVAPHWPHVHIEVVDTAVPDRPSSGSCD